ncbi:MAG: hypothetical protein GXW90_01090 [Tepidanaerobacter acetatoxydans]|uniref:hypothetical protein n=1 Tax=Tepidanaerobacter acetatoxydans TaxID=499229 RepID=UPI0026ED41E7|nr:hypothetical protein [Tepidanaerobacter acetatoxydans]NLU09539.1 hypothetical protein [Tepidanaerobacter acetatoxydans]
MKETIELTISTDNNGNIVKIGSELNLEQHEIIIDKNDKTIEGIKKFFEKLVLYSFQENRRFLIDMKEEEFSRNIDDDILHMLEEFIKQFNDINVKNVDNE